MANKTTKDAGTIHGTNPQYLIEKIIRTRIYESRYWKEDCFALSADLVVDKGVELRYIGGIYSGNIKPTPFLCLTLKLLQLQPEKDIIIEFIRQENFKYIRALGAFYLRLTSNSLDVYKYLEPLYNDFRKLRRMSKMGTFDIVYMDEFIDTLLREDRVFDVILPRLTKRFVHEENGELPKRISLIDEDLDLDENNADAEKNSSGDSEAEDNAKNDSDGRSHSRRRSPSVEKYKHRGESSRGRNRSSVSPHSRRSRNDDKDRSRRSRSRDRYDRHRDRDERHSRRSRSPGHRSSTRDRKHRDRDERKKEEGNTSKPSKEDEIAEMNALRAKLGMKPLKP